MEIYVKFKPPKFPQPRSKNKDEYLAATSIYSFYKKSDGSGGWWCEILRAVFLAFLGGAVMG